MRPAPLPDPCLSRPRAGQSGHGKRCIIGLPGARNEACRVTRCRTPGRKPGACLPTRCRPGADLARTSRSGEYTQGRFRVISFTRPAMSKCLGSGAPSFTSWTCRALHSSAHTLVDAWPWPRYAVIAAALGHQHLPGNLVPKRLPGIPRSVRLADINLLTRCSGHLHTYYIRFFLISMWENHEKLCDGEFPWWEECVLYPCRIYLARRGMRHGLRSGDRSGDRCRGVSRVL